MKLSELMKKINEGIPLYKCGIKVKNYLNIVDKKIIIAGLYEEEDLKKMKKGEILYNGIIDNVIIDTGGYFEIDYFLLESLYCTSITLNYTNIELDDEALKKLDELEESFADYLYRTGLFEHIKGDLDEDELDRFDRLLKLELEQRVKNLNSSIHTVNNIKKEVMGMIPSERKIKNIFKKIENFDTNKLKTITDLNQFAKSKK